MTEDLKNEVRAVLQKMSEAQIPCIFLAFSNDHFINLRNCTNQQTAQLIINQIESSDGMKEEFVKELEAVTIREMEAAQEKQS